MGIKDTLLLLVLYQIQLKICLVVALQDEPINCNRYTDNTQQELSCRPDGLTKLSDSVLADNIVTQDELLSEVEARCSNLTIKGDYILCILDLTVECPTNNDHIHDSTMEKLFMFCDYNNVSPWLKSVVKDGYSFNEACTEVSRQAMLDCEKSLNINMEKIGSNTSFVTASRVVPKMISDMFGCMKTKLALIPAPKHECGSSWQDILLEYWLRVSAKGSLFVTLPHENRQELLALRTGSGAENLK